MADGRREFPHVRAGARPREGEPFGVIPGTDADSAPRVRCRCAVACCRPALDRRRFYCRALPTDPHGDECPCESCQR